MTWDYIKNLGDDEICDLFRSANDSGLGFDPEYDIDDWDLLYTTDIVNGNQSDRSIMVYDDCGEIVLVANDHGLWAVRL